MDHDGKISFEDYEMTVKDEPLLLEAFGQCLPSSESIVAFLITLRPWIIIIIIITGKTK